MITQRLPQADLTLLLEVLRWAYRNGWRRTVRPRRVSGRIVWTGDAGQLVIYDPSWTPADPSAGMLRVRNSDRTDEMSLPRPLRHILSGLAAAGILPGRFSESGADALRDYADEGLDYIEQLVAEHDDDRNGMRVLFAAGVYRAVDAANKQADTGAPW